MNTHRTHRVTPPARRTTGLLAGGAAALLALTGCSAPASQAGGDDVHIAQFAGWGESIVTSELWKLALEDEGYDVTITAADVSPVFIGLADGSYDFATQITLPEIHRAFVDEYGDDLVDLGPWYEETRITVAVNEDAPIDSLAELADHADAFDNKIVGIEPGAGQTILMEDTVIPGYGLQDMDFVTSSTAAMLSALKGATDTGKNIAVSLWEPHWAYLEYPIKNLEDPEGLLGQTEAEHVYASTAFPEAQPEVAQWLREFSMTPDELMELERQVFVVHGDSKPAVGVAAWAEANPEFMRALTA